jgi:transcriptional regulator of acetoin/glycerol metabolism
LAEDGIVTPAALGLASAVEGSDATPRSHDEPTREQVSAALAAAGGVVSHAAQTLGLSRQALYRRMERWGLSDP